jgi:hypothetical protein
MGSRAANEKINVFTTVVGRAATGFKDRTRSREDRTREDPGAERTRHSLGAKGQMFSAIRGNPGLHLMLIRCIYVSLFVVFNLLIPEAPGGVSCRLQFE